MLLNKMKKVVREALYIGCSFVAGLITYSCAYRSLHFENDSYTAQIMNADSGLNEAVAVLPALVVTGSLYGGRVLFSLNRRNLEEKVRR